MKFAGPEELSAQISEKQDVKRVSKRKCRGDPARGLGAPTSPQDTGVERGKRLILKPGAKHVG